MVTKKGEAQDHEGVDDVGDASEGFSAAFATKRAHFRHLAHWKPACLFEATIQFREQLSSQYEDAYDDPMPAMAVQYRLGVWLPQNSVKMVAEEKCGSPPRLQPCRVEGVRKQATVRDWPCPWCRRRPSTCMCDACGSPMCPSCALVDRGWCFCPSCAFDRDLWLGLDDGAAPFTDDGRIEGAGFVPTVDAGRPVQDKVKHHRGPHHAPGEKSEEDDPEEGEDERADDAAAIPLPCEEEDAIITVQPVVRRSGH